MALILELVLFVGGLGVALIGSSRAVAEARALASALGAPPFLIGVTVVAVGTDLPEIANSITSHLQGKGDINVGDSIGSVLTQYTLVLAVMPFVFGAFRVNRREVIIVGSLTVPGLVLSAVLVADGWLGHLDGLFLVATWLVLLTLAIRILPRQAVEDLQHNERSHLVRVGLILVALLFVGIGASLAVRSLVNLAELAGVSEFLIAYFGAALATSAPELVVVITAASRGAYGLALGDALGASFVDSTLSIGAGPLIAGAAVTAHAAVSGITYALLATVAATILLAAYGRHNRRIGLALLALYALAYAVVIRGI
jgi:cation:H+ antiporter